MNQFVRYCCLALVAGCATAPAPADLVVVGKIYTVDDSNPVAEAVAVKNGRIVFVGAEAAGRKYIASGTRVVELGSKVMVPGLIESHGHLMEVGYGQLQLDLSQVKSYEEIVEHVQAAVDKAGPGVWIVGRGWHQDKWDHPPPGAVKGFQTHHLLSAVSPRNPVYLAHASGHAGMANARAMELAGIGPLSRETPLPGGGEGGEVLRDEMGNPTGIFSENAMGLITRHIPDNTPGRDAEALALAMRACVERGITSFHDAGASQTEIDLYKKFRERDSLQVRLYVMLGGASLARKWFSRGPEIDSACRLTIRSVKLSCDGALGSRGAWLLEPYADRPGFNGMATLPMDTVLTIARLALKAGFQVCTHAIGDRANREVLDRYALALNEHPAAAKNHRFRIEHAQHLHPDDIPRFGKLGVIPAMQAIHMSSDRPWAIDRLGEKRIREGAYVWQSLLRSGARIANGTDAPVEPLDPMPSFYASVSRRTLAGTPEGGYEPHEKMTRAEALKSYTLDAAHAAFQEEMLGSIETGKFADFTILSQDIMAIPEADIPGTEAVMTVVGGKIVFEK